MKKVFLICVLFLTTLLFSKGRSFVPRECSVEDWCIVKATACFTGYVTHPSGLYQAHAQYSVVRRVLALCHVGSWYGEERPVWRNITGPVEPVRFKSPEEVTEENARKKVLEKCELYRADYLAAAPFCNSDVK